MFVPLLRAVIESNVLGFLVELKICGRSKPLGEGGLVVKLVRELVSIEHGLGVNTRGLGESGIECERGRSGEMPCLVGQQEESLLGIGFVRIEWDVARPCRRGFERGILAGLAGRRLGGSHESDRRMNRNNTGAQQEREQ